MRVPIGLARVAGVLFRWAADMGEASEGRRAALSAGEVGAFVALSRLASERRVVRAKVALVGLVVLLVGYGVMRWLAPPHTGSAILAVLVLGLALAGRRKEHPILSTAVVRRGYVRLTEPMVYRALAAAGLGGKPPKPKANRGSDSPTTVGNPDEDTAVGTPTILVPGCMRDGEGWRVVVDLPRGRTFEHATARRSELASGLDVAAVQVFLEADQASARRVTLWVSDVDPFAGKARRSPLAKCPPVSVWDEHQLGTEPRGRTVRAALLFAGFLIGSVPRVGKTLTARTLVAPAILDPACDLTVLDFKGGRDWKACEAVAVTYRSGDDDEDIVYGLAVLDRIIGEARTRFAAFRSMSDEQCPESKLTRELAAHGMHPHVVVLDEVQNLLRHPVYGKDALPRLVWLAKTGPAAGYTLVPATQRPSADVIDTDLRDNISVRLALKTMDWRSSDTILGASAASIGIESYSLQKDRHKGVAVVRGLDNGRGGDFQTVRVDLLTAPDFSRICAVGRQRRIDAGTLRGMAAGDADAVAVEVSIVADVLAVWPGAEPKVQAAALCERLATLRPALYAGMEPAALTAALGRHQVPVVQVNRAGTNRNGYPLAAVRQAAGRAVEP